MDTQHLCHCCEQEKDLNYSCSHCGNRVCEDCYHVTSEMCDICEINLRHVNSEIQRNDVLRSVQELLTTQTAKGLAKYGHTVTPDALSLCDWIVHVQQEHADAIVYLEVLKRRLCDEPKKG